ncbi:hypothetical protein CTRI78_v007198 [Colletotrichum trifolii]|uniref:Uncharacterized protein n=1 Tax=Colletotrichum trifolii TaxID=5466 RepID=A0A4V3HVQ5_COLTR|nr:hypothetical protein CTRI78_v007198 [Colletotrichum trifolii]
MATSKIRKEATTKLSPEMECEIAFLEILANHSNKASEEAKNKAVEKAKKKILDKALGDCDMDSAMKIVEGSLEGAFAKAKKSALGNITKKA